MSDPLKNEVASRRAKKEDLIREKYVPVVLWLKTPENHRVHESRKYLQKKAEELPHTLVAMENEPYWFATDGTYNVEESDGESND